MFGLMKSIHSDNGREFHGRAFQRGYDLNGVETIYRPPATPRFGGHLAAQFGGLVACAPFAVVGPREFLGGFL
jgi:putative transposase